MSLPGISAICSTYGRVGVLEEAIESFRRQTYSGPKEMVILNDCPHQTLRCDIPGVVCINEEEPYESLGEKFNASVARCQYPLLMVWNDDDIQLPTRMEVQVNFMSAIRTLAVVDHKLWSVGNDWSWYTTGINTLMVTREAFDAVGGFKHLSQGHANDLWSRLLNENLLSTRFNKKHETVVVYRTMSGATPHASALANDPDMLHKIQAIVDQRIASGQEPSGDILAGARWDADYVALAAAAAERTDNNGPFG